MESVQGWLEKSYSGHPGVLFYYPGISKCRSQYDVSVESLFHHSIYPWLICFPEWSIDELENLHADRTTNCMFWVKAEAESEVGIP